MLRLRFFLTFSFFLLIWGVEMIFSRGGAAPKEGASQLVSFSDLMASRSAEIKQIDAQIQQLENMKRGYEARALKHENMAEYLQFDQQAVLETRRHWQLAEENRRKAALAQEEIDRLKVKREQLSK